MTPAPWADVEALLDTVLDLAPEDRAARLEDPSTADAEVRAEVARLLVALRRNERFLEKPAAEYAAELVSRFQPRADPAASAPDRIGPYRVIREIGRGGMGAVYLAERDDEQYAMQVAVKLLPHGMSTASALRRFRAERQILALLVHPNIARLLDGGVTPDGTPWFAMEHVTGVPIVRYCETHDLPTTARLALFRSVCSAVQFAHRNLVVHRDLKPANILVAHDGTPKLLDFGIARLLGEGDALAAALTATGLHAMTPEYASPEQVRGDPVSTASDVYSLGVLLYVMLCGHHPYALRGAQPHELARATLETEPAPPSTRAALPAAHALRGDLDAIVLRAMQKEPERRYGSVQSLSDDIGRHLAGLPVHARPKTIRYRAGKFMRRNRSAVGAAAVLVVSLLGGLLGTAWQARAAARETERAEVVRDFLIGLFTASDPADSRGDGISARELLDRGAAHLDTALVHRPMIQAEMLGILGTIYRDLGSYTRAEPLLRRALHVRATEHGAADERTTAAQHELARLLLLMGRQAEAEALHRDALAVRRARFGASHPHVANSLAGLAEALERAARYDEAEPLYREAIAIRIRHFGADDPVVADALDALGSLLRAKGDLAGAEAAWRQTVAIRTRVLGADHLSTAASTKGLALLLSDRDELDEAETLFRQVLAFDRRRLGEEHPSTAVVMHDLASVLRRKGELDEAERWYREALAIDRRVRGDAHPGVATVHARPRP